MSFSNGPTTVTNGLVLALDAADKNSYPGSGTSWFDLSGNNNTGTLTNGPTFNSGNAGSIVFDGVDDYVNLTTSSLKLNDVSVTMNVWFKTNINSNSYQDIIVLGSSAQDNIMGILKSRSGLSNGSVYAAFFQSNQGITTFSTLSGGDLVTAGIINYSAVFTKVGSYYNIFLYRNGVLDNSVATTLTSYNMTSWSSFFARLGSGGPSYPEILNGNMYQTSIYNRALSSQEILQNYNATKTRFGL
jgi:hypothetical protein